MKLSHLIFAGIIGITIGYQAPVAQAAKGGVRLGQLSCEVAGGTGFVFGSSKALDCTYTPFDNTHSKEIYVGVIKKFGIDVGFTDKSTIFWTVIAASDRNYTANQLAGNYAGASAEATAAFGLGANVLVGGTSDSFTLQPVSISASQGINVAVGLTQIKLTAKQS